MVDYDKNNAEILDHIKGGEIINSFGKVWEKIDGANKPYTKVLKTLFEEISRREHLGSELFRNQDFKTLTKVEQERDAFIQAQYGLQDLAYLGEPERLKEIGFDESPIWKEARAKGIEIQGREKVEVLDIFEATV